MRSKKVSDICVEKQEEIDKAALKNVAAPKAN